MCHLKFYIIIIHDRQCFHEHLPNKASRTTAHQQITYFLCGFYSFCDDVRLRENYVVRVLASDTALSNLIFLLYFSTDRAFHAS